MSDPKYVRFIAAPDGSLVPTEILEPQLPSQTQADELWNMAERIEDISDEIEGQSVLIHSLRKASWALRAAVLEAKR